jgi:small-conductance mechanosensitive channel
MHTSFWKKLNITVVLFFIIAIVGASFAGYEWNAHGNTINHRLLAIVGILIFLFFASTTLNMFTGSIRKYTYPHLGVGRAATIQFTLRTIGYLLIILETLSLMNIPIQALLLGGAVTGIIVGVAAQQSLANFFASIILLISRPFKIGQRTIIKSGAFGEYTGIIIDMGLTHTRLEMDDGNVVLLPNATVLSSAAVMPLKQVDQSKKQK